MRAPRQSTTGRPATHRLGPSGRPRRAAPRRSICDNGPDDEPARTNLPGAAPSPEHRPRAAEPGQVATLPDSRASPGAGPVQRAAGLPLVAKAGLALVVVAFGLVVLLNAPGVIGAFVGGIGNALGGVAGKLSPTAAPSATDVVLPPSPSLAVPTQPYTNQPKLDLTGTIPNSVAGQSGYTIRIYRKVGTAAADQVAEIPVGRQPDLHGPGRRPGDRLERLHGHDRQRRPARARRRSR